MSMSMRYTVQSRRRKGVNALEMVKWTPPRPLHRMSTQAVVCLPDSWQLPITTGKSYAQGVSPRWRNGGTVETRTDRGRHRVVYDVLPHGVQLPEDGRHLELRLVRRQHAHGRVHRLDLRQPRGHLWLS